MKAQSLLCNLSLTVIAALALSLSSCQEQLQLQQIGVTKVAVSDQLTATCTVSITNDGTYPILESGIVYDSKDWNDQKVIKAKEASNGSFDVTIPQLLPGSIYGVRGYYKTEKGLVYSSIYEFTTKILEGTVKDADNNEYKTIKIGKYEWMAENLRATKLADQSAITNAANGMVWRNASILPKYCEYTGLDVAKYGRLYNAYSKSKTIIEGWRVPSAEEWKALQNHLISHRYGNDKVEDNFIAKSMASTDLWSESTVAGTIGFEPLKNNTTGFNAVPGGYRQSDGNAYVDSQTGAYYWSSSAMGSLHFFATLKHNELGLDLESKSFSSAKAGVADSKYGFSIRLVRDLVITPDVD